ncbi:putative F-box/FBD/LRR-repeat protein [Cardamine amara subsp. amara]|uniref:F-box/FBD/LRR-repeat protein n=1 Tax=Cardamine amara subsp. amara TaxID=228776 RepID=A0ABD1AIP7_CARAN
MVGKGTSKLQARSKKSSSRLKEDKINQLPDALLCQIISHLTTKEAVSTSVLSIRWRSLWLWLPRLELNSRKFQDYNAFLSFGNKFFDSSRVSCIDKLKLTLGKDARTVVDTSCFTSWIDALIKRKIQHLHIRYCFKEINYLDTNRIRLYNCETLVYLRLFGVTVHHAVFVVLPCLKTMYLEKIWFYSEATLEKMISSCPVLENLTIVASDNDTKDYRVHSRSLKRLTIKRDRVAYLYSSPGVVIDAPLLRCLTIDDHESKSFIVNNLETNAKLNVSLYFGLLKYSIESMNYQSMRSSIRDFLLGISRVGNMTICPFTFKLICGCSELEPLPQFGNMSKLCVSLYASNVKCLEKFLRSFPNLKSLILVMQFDYFMHYEEKNYQISFPSVPECLLSSLEFVDFKLEIRGHAEEMELVRYFLENSAILKKFTLRLANHSTKDEICKGVFKIPTSSPKCELVIL